MHPRVCAARAPAHVLTCPRPPATRHLPEGTADENIEERVERLAVKDSREIEARRKEAEQKFYSQYSYKPEINHTSRVMGRTSGKKELVYNPRGQAARYKAAKAAEERLLAECTFRPKLNAKRPSPGQQSQPGPPGLPLRHAWGHDERQAWRQREQAEMEVCVCLCVSAQRCAHPKLVSRMRVFGKPTRAWVWVRPCPLTNDCE